MWPITSLVFVMELLRSDQVGEVGGRATPSLPTSLCVRRRADDVLRPRVEQQVQLGDHAAEPRGAGEQARLARRVLHDGVGRPGACGPETTASTAAQPWAMAMPARRARALVVRRGSPGRRPRGAARRSSSRPCAFSSGTSALSVSTSSVNLDALDAAWLTIEAVPSSVMPMKPTFWLLDLGPRWRGRGCGGCAPPGRRTSTLALRYGSRRRAKPLPGGRSPAVGPVAVVEAAAGCMRLSSPVALVELVVADRGDLQADLVHRLDRRLVVERADSSGEAPIRSRRRP